MIRRTSGRVRRSRPRSGGSTTAGGLRGIDEESNKCLPTCTFTPSTRLLDGLSRIPDVLDRVQALGQEAVAITDHGVLYGAIDFYKEARARGIKPIIGIEAYVAPGSRLEPRARANNSFHLTLLARNETGYRNLLAALHAPHLEGYYYKPRMDQELLAAARRRASSRSRGCPSGEMHRLLARSATTMRSDAAGWYRDVFDGTTTSRS